MCYIIVRIFTRFSLICNTNQLVLHRAVTPADAHTSVSAIFEKSSGQTNYANCYFNLIKRIR